MKARFFIVMLACMLAMGTAACGTADQKAENSQEAVTEAPSLDVEDTLEITVEEDEETVIR